MGFQLRRNEKFSHLRLNFQEFFRFLRQFFGFYGSLIRSDFVTAKARKDPKMTQIPPFLCNDPEKKSTWYTILHITQIHVFMTCHHWNKRNIEKNSHRYNGILMENLKLRFRIFHQYRVVSMRFFFNIALLFQKLDFYSLLTHY